MYQIYVFDRCFKLSDVRTCNDISFGRKFCCKFNVSSIRFNTRLNILDNLVWVLQVPVRMHENLTSSTITLATNGFSSENKLGQGGFGPVFKVTIYLVLLR